MGWTVKDKQEYSTSGTTFGLRDRESGRFLRVECQSNTGKDFCGDETCTFSDYEGDPRFECESLARLISVMASDVDWFNSERTRPCHGKFRMEDFEPWAFVHEEVHDEIGGDPVEVRQHASRLKLPAFVQGEAMNSVQPEQTILERAFGATADLAEDAWPFVTILRPEGPIEEGMIVANHMYGFGIVVAEAAVPADWPIDPGRPFDRKDPAFRLVLARADLLRDLDFVRGYIEDDQETSVPALR